MQSQVISLYWAHFSTCKVRGGSPALPAAWDKYMGVAWTIEMRHISAFLLAVTLDSLCCVLLPSGGAEGSRCSVLAGVRLGGARSLCSLIQQDSDWAFLLGEGGFASHIMTWG